MTGRTRSAPVAMAAGAVVLLLAVGPCRPVSTGTVGAREVERLSRPTPTRGGPVPVLPGALPPETVKAAPVRLEIPAIGVDAAVDQVGVDRRTNELAVPPRVDRVGWYRHGPGLEARAGSVVVAGHVDDADDGEGAFFRLRELDPGDTVTATGSDGRRRHYRVVGREEYAKTTIPLDRYFARDGQVRLTLITCGGPFEAKTGGYRDNLVVTAVPR